MRRRNVKKPHTVIKLLTVFLISLLIFLFCESCTNKLPQVENNKTEINSKTETTDEESKTTPVMASADTTRKAESTNQEAQSKEEILELYSAAVNRIAKRGEAGYKEKKWGKLNKVNSGDEKADDIFRYFAELFLTTEDETAEEVRKKGSEKSMKDFPECSMTDGRYIESAKCVSSGDIYQIEIVFASDNPDEEGSHLAQVSQSVFYWKDIKSVLDKIPMIESIDEELSQVVYNDYTITCTLTKDGEIISMSHIATVDVIAVAVVKLVKSYDVSFTAQFQMNFDYYDFDYN